jgi:hypothetical protein
VRGPGGRQAAKAETALEVACQISLPSPPDLFSIIMQPRPPTRSLYCRGQILSTHPAYARTVFLRLLSRAGVRLHENTGISSVEPNRLVLENGQTAAFDECLWCTQAAAAGWLKGTGLPLTADGFVAIDDCMRADGGPEGVFACGDVATSTIHPRPKAGVFAVRQVRGGWPSCSDVDECRQAVLLCAVDGSTQPLFNLPHPPHQPEPHHPPASTGSPPGRQPPPPPQRPAPPALHAAVNLPQPHLSRRPVRGRNKRLDRIRGGVGVVAEGLHRPGVHEQVWIRSAV